MMGKLSSDCCHFFHRLDSAANHPNLSREERKDLDLLVRLVCVRRVVAWFGEDLPDVLAWCCAHNPSLSVTGVLCSLDGVCMHCLDGEAAIVTQLFEQIRVGMLHRNATVLELRAILLRSCPEWSTKLLKWDEKDTVIFGAFRPGRKWTVTPRSLRL